MFKSVAALFLLFLAVLGVSPGSSWGAERKFVHIERADIPVGQRMINFSVLYGIQWGAYVVTQHGAIRRHGSFENWTRYPFRPHFDLDGINFNIFGHTFSGQFYYQYYRARGYGEGASFLWAIISSTAFEFTIETVTERPSFQDLYQTPVFGTIVGAGLERASFFFHSMDVWPARVLGYILNPFTLIPGTSYGFIAAPIVQSQASGLAVSWKF